MKEKNTKKIKKKPDAKAENLEEQLENLQKEKDELFAQLQRVSADYANYQKRAPKQIADSISYEKEKIIKTLLPILDNFEHTLQNADTAESIAVLAEGIRIVYDQMLEALKSNNVERIESLGEKFNPALHQAMMRRAEADKEDDIVLEEFQAGYKLNGRVIRPGKVIVNKHETQQQETENIEG
ncbi:nucleotide exchange factor GrpE [Planctomycetota bacterium]